MHTYIKELKVSLSCINVLKDGGSINDVKSWDCLTKSLSIFVITTSGQIEEELGLRKGC